MKVLYDVPHLPHTLYLQMDNCWRENKNTFVSIVMHNTYHKKVQVGKDQEKAQSEKDSHSKNRGGKKPN